MQVLGAVSKVMALGHLKITGLNLWNDACLKMLRPECDPRAGRLGYLTSHPTKKGVLSFLQSLNKITQQ